MDGMTPRIDYLSYDCLETENDGMKHIKSLPMLSIVRAREGQYLFGLDSDPLLPTGEGGFFVAPRDRLQTIVHQVNPISKKMRADWIFLDVNLHGRYVPEDLYELPTILPPTVTSEAGRLLDAIEGEKSELGRIGYALLLLNLVLSVSVEKGEKDSLKCRMRNFVYDHLWEVTPLMMADYFYISLPTLYRYCVSFFGMSPGRYIIFARLQKASLRLIQTNLSVKTISAEVGFSDEFYFSKLFKQRFTVSPKEYRNRIRNG